MFKYTHRNSLVKFICLPSCTQGYIFDRLRPLSLIIVITINLSFIQAPYPPYIVFPNTLTPNRIAWFMRIHCPIPAFANCIAFTYKCLSPVWVRPHLPQIHSSVANPWITPYIIIIIQICVCICVHLTSYTLLFAKKYHFARPDNTRVPRVSSGASMDVEHIACIHQHAGKSTRTRSNNSNMPNKYEVI